MNKIILESIRCCHINKDIKKCTLYLPGGSTNRPSLLVQFEPGIHRSLEVLAGVAADAVALESYRAGVA